MLNIQNNFEDKINSTFKVSTTCRKNNPDTNIPTVMFFFQESFCWFKVHYYWNFYRTPILIAKKLAICFELEQKNTNIFYWGFVSYNWFHSTLSYFFLSVFLSVLLVIRNSGNNMLKISRYFISIFSNNYINKDEHLEVYLSVQSRTLCGYSPWF